MAAHICARVPAALLLYNMLVGVLTRFAVFVAHPCVLGVGNDRATTEGTQGSSFGFLRDPLLVSALGGHRVQELGARPRLEECPSPVIAVERLQWSSCSGAAAGRWSLGGAATSSTTVSTVTFPLTTTTIMAPEPSTPTPPSSPHPVDALLALTQQLTPSKSPRTVRKVHRGDTRVSTLLNK
ncbi:hypothetical protein B0H17DRAFT_543373 [Mycena rosella]|uniref:Uncharacterized protein n=1 Tax=Mycena rosella TaxID=1033263 RepID=A0AAD7BT94_MYCRO|nr:hypothetical protein B0H17DRAFT_543373 [Mycena rosella]